MNKYVKYTSIGVISLIPIGFIIGFSRAWNSPPSITAAGSSAVQPLLTELGTNYKDADVVVQPGGSSLGLKVAADLSKSLGNASKNPYKSVSSAQFDKNGYTSEMWKNNGLKTVTIAWDGIAIVYKKEKEEKNPLVINKDNISMIYEVFAGTNNYSLNQLFIGPGNVDNYSNLNWSPIKPYARTGGSDASGTATSFTNESMLLDSWPTTKDESYWKDVESRLKTGKYGSNVSTTNESNVESWTRFSIENKPGSMIYLSLGFAEMNKEIIEQKGYSIARYYNYNDNNIYEASTENVTSKKYGWYSPLNTIIATNATNQTTKDFVWWLLTDNNVNRNDPNNKGIIQKAGYAPLSIEDKAKMFYDYNYGGLPSVDIADNINNYKELFFNTVDIPKDKDINQNTTKWFGVAKV